MKPVRIKYYGLFWMTKQTYYLLLVGLGCVALSAMLILVLADRLPPRGWPWVQKPAIPGTGFGPFVVNHFYFIILVCLVAQAIDTLMVLRAFAKKEAEQRAMLDALENENRTTAPETTPTEGIQPVPGVHAARSASTESNH